VTHLLFQRTLRAVLISLAAIFGVAVVTGLTWLCRWDPGINFLPSDKRAEWILFPAAVEVETHRVANVDTIFRRDFNLGSPPPTALLRVRAAKRIQLTINDQKIDFIANHDWKHVSSAEVSSLLREGANRIEAKVFNDNSPPALWLSLEGDQLSLHSDTNWTASCAGSAWRRAIIAAAPRLPGRGNPIDSSERTLTALTNVWRLWLLFGAIALSLGISANWLIRRRVTNKDRMTLLIVFGFAGLWLILFWHNARLLPFAVGFDATHHLSYITYLQEHHSLPPPLQGNEMFQPPFYYLISAVVLSLFHLTTANPSGIVLLRTLTMLFGIGQILLVCATLRLLFPRRPNLQLVGAGLTAFLPMQLYMSHYPTNETLAGLLASASVYLALRITILGTNSCRAYSLLGLLLGAALLTKITAVLAVPFIVLALGRRLGSERASATKWTMTLGSMAVIAVSTCSWHYFRLSKYGSPLVGRGDPVTGLFWWQDGYRTISYFSRFGISLIRPLFSVTSSFLDGLYSTLWGDGLCAGVVDLSQRPPWNHSLMCAGYLLSLLPTTLLLIGAVTASVELFRDLRSDLFVLVGLPAAVAAALVYLNLKVPCYASVKAFYGLGALIPLGFFGAVGWKVITRGRRRRELLIGILLLVWAMNSFASFWIYNSVADHICAAMHLRADKKRDAALTEARKAVDADPSNATARVLLAMTLDEVGQSEEALHEAERAVELAPLNSVTHLELAALLYRQKNLEKAIKEARFSVDLGPENPRAHFVLLTSLFYHGEDASDAARQALAVSPYNAEIHHLLGAALAQKGDAIGAFNQLAYAVLIKPEWTEAGDDLHSLVLALVNSSAAAKLLHQAALSVPDSTAALDELAWVFATNPSDELRDGNEAVLLAEHACALTKRTDAMLLATLAAAYAETGNFGEAINTIHESLSKGRSTDNADAIALGEQLLSSFQSDAPIREDPNGK
jgi:Flp pilus assembly protein TadD